MTTHTRDRSRRSGGGLSVDSAYLWRARRADCRHRLICFPHAGGAAGAFADWVAPLAPEIEVSAVQLPGRQNRLLEDPPTEVAPLVREVVQALRPILDRPFSFFGHSCGALLAFEVARALSDLPGPRPARLFLSGESSPQAARGRRQLHSLSEDEFRAEVLKLGGFDAELLEEEGALDALLPLLVADFRLWERHRMVPGTRLRTPITAVTGEADVRAPSATLDGWAAHTTAAFDKHVYPGDHFYLFDESVNAGLLDLIRRKLLDEPTDP